MLILGIDPGTKCGWAILDGGRRVASGVWDLSAKRHEGGGMRYVRLRGYLREVFESSKIEAVAYEEVRRHMGVDAAHVYGGITAVISSVCESWKPKIPYRAIPVGTVKKLATGKGNASKGQMIEAARERFDLERVAEDEADALHIGYALTHELGAFAF